MRSRDFDALVIGAGPAGTSIAIRLALARWRVVLIEQSVFPRHKVCGECLGPASLDLLDELGIGAALIGSTGPEIRRVGWMTRTQTLIADMPACASGPHRYGRAIGRDRLDSLLLDRARELGVQVIQPARVLRVRGMPGAFLCEYGPRTAADRQPFRAIPDAIVASIVLDAHGSWEAGPAMDDGAHCESRRTRAPNSDLLAFKATYRNAALPIGVLPVLAMPGGYGGMVVADRDRTTVACCVRRDALRECRQAVAGESAGAAVERFIRGSCRGAAEALRGARRETAWLAVGPLRPGFSTDRQLGVFPIGNAAAEAHPVIGEGICMALQSAALLADALRSYRKRIDADSARVIQRRYDLACRIAFRRRLSLSRAYAQVAMRPTLSQCAAALMRWWPLSLSAAALLAGKARPGRSP